MQLRNRVVALVLTLVLTFCLIAPQSASAQDDLVDVSQAGFLVIDLAPLFIGIENGYFADEGLNMSFVEIDSGLAEQIRNRLDTEDARLEMATRSVADQIDDVVRSGEIDRQLEERRRRLLGNTGGSGGAATEDTGAGTQQSNES